MSCRSIAAALNARREAAIERAREKRAQLAPQLLPARGASLRVFSILPRAAKMFRKQVTAGLDGNAKEALKHAKCCARCSTDTWT